MADAGFGGWISAAGDVNGDGFADVLISAPNFNNDRGQVFLFLGSANGLSSDPAWTVVGESSGALFGSVASGVGDINGDGFSDVMIGAPYQSNGTIKHAGCAYLFLGSAQGLASRPEWIYRGQFELGETGGIVQPAGDVNGDGLADVVVSSCHASKASVQVGRTAVFYGRKSGLRSEPDWIQEGDQPSAVFGELATTAGDVNHDGFDDVIVGVQHYNGVTEDEGKAFLFLGSATGLSHVPAWTAVYDSGLPRSIGGPKNQHFGNTVSAAGDVNGDGFADVLVTSYFAERDDSDEGMAFLYLGGASGLSSNPAWIGEGNQELATFGSFGAGIGDVNHDGFADIALGATLADHGEVNEGGAFVYYGSANGLQQYPDWSAEGNLPETGLGRNLARAGDVNHDGYDDFLVGAFLYSRNGQRFGKVWLHYGGPLGLLGSSNWSLKKSWWGEIKGRINGFLSHWGWVVAVCVIALGLFAGWQIRKSHSKSTMAAEAHRLSLIEERHRLARDLHDDLGSRLTRLAVLSELIGNDRDGASAELLAQSTQDVMAEMQLLVWAVNPGNDTLEGLASFLSSCLHRFFSGTSIRAISDIPNGLPHQSLSGEVRREVVLCVKEAFANTLKHADATEVCLRLHYDAPIIRITVSDNGRGFAYGTDPILAPNDSGSGNGLGNMSQRMKSIGANLKIETAPGNGTTVLVEVTLLDA